jgi:hypothetical protein
MLRGEHIRLFGKKAKRWNLFHHCRRAGFRARADIRKCEYLMYWKNLRPRLRCWKAEAPVCVWREDIHFQP